jgi:hypothetical protein
MLFGVHCGWFGVCVACGCAVFTPGLKATHSCVTKVVVGALQLVGDVLHVATWRCCSYAWIESNTLVCGMSWCGHIAGWGQLVVLHVSR